MINIIDPNQAFLNNSLEIIIENNKIEKNHIFNLYILKKFVVMTIVDVFFLLIDQTLLESY